MALAIDLNGQVALVTGVSSGIGAGRRNLYRELDVTNRTVGAAPGFVDTPDNGQWFNSFPKLGTPEEVGAPCAFLVSPYAAFVSGTTYLMNGGRSALMQDA